MKFLAIDTSAKYLGVLAYADGYMERTYLPDCAMKHSIVLMDTIEDVLRRAHMSPKECDFFAVVIGPGSFTGIRIGISTIKGLCFACEKPALSVTSFDTLAYDGGNEPQIALVDAGHGYFYGCAYDAEKRIVHEPAYMSREEVDKLIQADFSPIAAEALIEGCAVKDPCEGLFSAVLAKAEECASASELRALYLRKSSAEENKK